MGLVPAQFTYSLNVGLFHRWEPGRLFMILTTYIDESGTHGDSAVTVMAGYVGHSGQWRKFDKKWGRMLGNAGASHFHAKDFVKRSGEFRGWDLPKQNRFIDSIDQICRINSLFGFIASINNADYDKYYVAEGRPRKIQADSRYGACFRLCLMFVPKLVHELYGERDLTLNFVLESGHKNAGDAVRIFDLFKKQAPEEWRHIAGTITFADKMDCYGVQAADSLAWTGYKVELRGNVAAKPFERTDETWTPEMDYIQGPRPVFRLKGTPNVLTEMRDSLISHVAEREAHWKKPKVSDVLAASSQGGE